MRREKINEKIFVPPLKIQGIKTKLVSLIKQNMILENDTIWIEPFMSSGVVGFNLTPVNAIFSDKNPHIINFYNSIKNETINSKIVKEFLKTEGEKLLNSGVKFMLSTWHSNKYRKNEYIDKIWKFCNIIKKEHFYFVGAKEQNRNSITEALLINYNTQLKINKIKSEEKNMQQLELF